MEITAECLLRFLEPQIQEYGANLEVDAGLWVVFAIPAGNEDANSQARALLQEATFTHGSGLSSDDQWMLYYVDSANRLAAVHWLDDMRKVALGEIRPTAPAHRALLGSLIVSDKPHRLAQQLVELHAQGETTAGLLRDPALVRACLDRLHQREPLFFCAFHTLLIHHLVDLVVLLRQLISEDVALINDIVKSSLSADPFLQSRQDAAAGIRSLLIRFQLINPLDQQKSIAITNPYAVHLDIHRNGDEFALSIDGINIPVASRDFLSAVRSIRKSLYRGESFRDLDTGAPWMSESIAYPCRFIKHRLDGRRDLGVMDALYMLERAVCA